MENKGSLPHSQAHNNYPYPEPEQSRPRRPIPLLEYRFNIILPSIRGSSKLFFQ